MFDDDIFKEFRRLLKSFGFNEEEFTDSMRKRSLKPGKVYRWGYSFSLGPDGIPKYKISSNIPGFELDSNKERVLSNMTDSDPLNTDEEFSGYRKPHYDLMRESKILRAIIELPGISKSDIEVQAKSNSLLVTAVNNNYKYKTLIPLDIQTIPKKIKGSFKNGVLELEIPIKKKIDDQGERINIE